MHFSEQVITIIILATLTGNYLIGMIADFLNLKNLNQPLPIEFKDHYNQKKYNGIENSHDKYRNSVSANVNSRSLSVVKNEQNEIISSQD